MFITCAQSTGLGPELIGTPVTKSRWTQVGRVLLIIGAVAGWLLFALYTVVLIAVIVQPDANQSDEVVGSIAFMVIGAVVAAPCTFFAYRMGRGRAQPLSPGGSTALAKPGADVQQSYLAWFGWCQQALPGDAVSLHAATMAAMAAGAAGNPTAAASAEAARQSARLAASGVMPSAPNAAKVRMLSRIGASTVGLLEPSERVLVSFWGENRSVGLQVAALLFGVIGRTIAARSTGAVFVTVTDRRVIAVIGGLFGGLASRIGLIEARSTVSAKFRKVLFGRGAFSINGLGGASVAMNVPRAWRPEAEMALALLAPSPGQVGSVGVIR
jgi:hypothetical protein